MDLCVVSKKYQKIAAAGDGVIVAFNYSENEEAVVPEELKQLILDLEKNL
jgi:hypothetical protein